MRLVKFKTSDGDVSINFPERFNEMTLAQVIELEQRETVDPLEMFSILTGLDLMFLDNQEIQLENQLFEIIEPLFSQSIDPQKLVRPERLLIDGTPYVVPRPDKQTLGQSILFLQIIEQNEKLQTFVPELLAIYFQPVIDGGQFNRERLPAIREMMLRAPGVDALAVFGFFLTNCKNWKNIIPRVYNQMKLTQFPKSLTMKKRYSDDSIGLTK